MRRPDYVLLTTLFLFAAFIWLRDLRWLDSAADTLPILAALPVALWLGAPWRIAPGRWQLATGPAVAAVVMFPLGMLLDSTLLLTASWTALAWSWMSRRVVDGPPPVRRKLLALGFVAFPWVATELVSLGWWFRLSGAAGAEHVLGWAGYQVLRQGTFMQVNGFAVSVEPACSGMNGLQALLVAGTTLAYLRLRHTPLFWWNLALLPAAAWAANLIRIMIGSAAGASMSPAAAARWVEPLHLFAGWFALVVMFALCWVLFSAQERAAAQRRARTAGTASFPWLETVLVGYAAWSARGLLDTWFTAPFDRMGWLAFAIWVIPLAWWAHRARSAGEPAFMLRTPWRAGAGVLLLLAGDAADLNVCRHAGLGFVLAGFAPARGAWLWWAGAVAWIPALGWVGSRLGFPPALVAALRVVIALAAIAAAARRRAAAPPRAMDPVAPAPRATAAPPPPVPAR